LPLGISVLGRRRRVTTREPGDLPSAVVTREDVGRGVQTLASPEVRKAQGWDFVRCDVPLTSYRGPTMSSIIPAASRRRRSLLASTVVVPIASLGISTAGAQQAAPDRLPAIEISSPDDANRTRARPVADEGSGPHRPAPKVAQPGKPDGAPTPTPPAGDTVAKQQFAGIV